MNISILCSDILHPIYPWLSCWVAENEDFNCIELVTSKSGLSGGDILFLISCHEIIGRNIIDRYKKALVIHASDLPNGRGWSPVIWGILEGKNEIVVTLLDASDKVDSGAIWRKKTLYYEGGELSDEINEKLFKSELELMDFAINNIDNVMPVPQEEGNATYYPKRSPSDSRLDPDKTIAEQFDLLRVSDPIRFPAFMDFRGCRYIFKLEKLDKNNKG